MGSVGKTKETHTYEDIKGTPLIFGTAHIAPEFIDIDGYSNKKTIKGALSDLAKALDKYDKNEADGLRTAISNDETEQILPSKQDGAGQYILEYEEVPSAARYKEGTEDMEYKPAKWYVHTRIVRG